MPGDAAVTERDDQQGEQVLHRHQKAGVVHEQVGQVLGAVQHAPRFALLPLLPHGDVVHPEVQGLGQGQQERQHPGHRDDDGGRAGGAPGSERVEDGHVAVHGHHGEGEDADVDGDDLHHGRQGAHEVGQHPPGAGQTGMAREL